MKQALLVVFKQRRILAVLLGSIAFTCGIFWSGEQRLSWAAPGQSPYLQTIPTRLPTATLAVSPSVSPPAVSPSVAPPVSPPNEDNDRRGTETPSFQIPEGEKNNPTTSTPSQSSLPEEPEASTTPVPGKPTESLETSIASPSDNTRSPGSISTSTPGPASSPNQQTIIPEVTGRADSPFSLSSRSARPTLASALSDQSDLSSETAQPAYPTGSLYWLYALILGVILILLGRVLVSLSRFRRS